MSNGTTKTTIVVPCFNEAERIDPERFLWLSVDASVDLLFVDDGSTDETACLLGELAMLHPNQVEVLSLERNCGKGEAVRIGMAHALEKGADIVGYYDADMSTPPDELRRLVDTIRHYTSISVVIASRVRLLGCDVKRPTARHYLGRLFATVSGLALMVPVYDTQCGAKLFRWSPALVSAVSEPFVSRWAFDVELLSRLFSGTREVCGLPASAFLEVPLREWSHVGGSKLRGRSALRAGLDLLAITRRARAARRVAVPALQPAAGLPVLLPVPGAEDAA